MLSKERDPIRIAWLRAEPCPCGSGAQFGDCCLLADARIRGTVNLPMPPGPMTGEVHDGCYMNWTGNCSSSLSREHIVSQSVLSLFDDRYIAVNGTPWMLEGETKQLPIKALAANILCERHNAGMSSLDLFAGKIFPAVKWIYDDLANMKSLSRKRRWWLFSGDELELWLLKTAFGAYYSGNAAANRMRIRDTQDINSAILRALYGDSVKFPCGLYVMREGDRDVYRDQINFSPLSSDNNERMTGLRFRFAGLSLLMLIDPSAIYNQMALAPHSYRPYYIGFVNRKRIHIIALSWSGLHLPANNGSIFEVGGPARLRSH
jgi:SEC-C motif